MRHFIYSLVVVAAVGSVGVLSTGGAVAGINVNEKGNSVLCKGKKSCTWLKQACAGEKGKYTPGKGGTGKCNFPATAALGFTAIPKSTPKQKIQK